MLLSCFSERERLKTGIFSIWVLLWSGHVNVWPRPFYVSSQTLITCWRLQQCQCLINGKWSNYTERWAEDISSVKGRLLKACINSPPKKVLHPSKRKRHTSAMDIESDLKLTMYTGTKITLNDVYVSTFTFKSRFEKVIVQCWLKCLLMYAEEYNCQPTPKINILCNLGERERHLSLFMRFIQEISTKTITDSSHIEQSTRNIDCYGRCAYFLLGSCSNKNFGHIFEDVCFVFFHPQTFILQ